MDAVEAYLAKSVDDPIPGMEDIELPEPLEWIWRIGVSQNLFGAIGLRDGGLLDQPYYAYRDIEAAYLARDKWQRERAMNRNAEEDTTSDQVAQTPPMLAGGDSFLRYLKSNSNEENN